MERLLTVDELSDKLRVSRSTVYRWVHYDFVPYIKIGGAVRFDEKRVETWLRARARSGRNSLPVDLD